MQSLYRLSLSILVFGIPVAAISQVLGIATDWRWIVMVIVILVFNAFADRLIKALVP